MADDLNLEPAEVWKKTLADLKLQMTRPTFDTWLRSSFVISCEPVEGTDPSAGPLAWSIGVYNQYAVDWLSNRLAKVVIRSLERNSGRPVEVEFLARSPAPVMSREPLQSGSDGPAAGAQDPEVEPADESEPMLEAVREERITVSERGALKWTDFYIKFKVAFRKKGLRRLKGARLSVFLCLALHVDANGIAKPGGIEAIMVETDYSRGAVCSALDDLESIGLIDKIPQFRGADQYRLRGYAWFGKCDPAPALFEMSKFKK